MPVSPAASHPLYSQVQEENIRQRVGYFGRIAGGIVVLDEFNAEQLSDAQLTDLFAPIQS